MEYADEILGEQRTRRFDRRRGSFFVVWEKGLSHVGTGLGLERTD
jgi:hypothetical protein